jgi:CRISPR/Cas system-associated endonuclease Cas1
MIVDKLGLERTSCAVALAAAMTQCERPQPPRHPVNAILNYAYAVLESQVLRIATVSQGLDLTIGYLHTCRPGRVALVYDLMEPLRPQVDRSVLDFCDVGKACPFDFGLEVFVQQDKAFHVLSRVLDHLRCERCRPVTALVGIVAL